MSVNWAIDRVNRISMISGLATLPGKWPLSFRKKLQIYFVKMSPGNLLEIIPADLLETLEKHLNQAYLYIPFVNSLTYSDCLCLLVCVSVLHPLTFRLFGYVR